MTMGIFTASGLKSIAIILMVINHFSTLPLPVWDSFPFLFRLQWCVTRIAYPLFAFLLAEGMAHTRSREKYMLRLLILAVVSQPIYGWALIDGPLTTSSLNVFFDLLGGTLAIDTVDRFKDNNRTAIPVLLLALCVLSVRFAFSYNVVGVLLPLLFYLFRSDRKRMGAVLVPAIPLLVLAMYWIGYGRPWGSFGFFMCSEFCMVFSLPFILLYDGEKGKQLPKWFYYGFYPAHLLLLGLTRLLF